MAFIFKSKKGIIEVGFSWIFILIAGTVILGLFTYIGFSQGSLFKTLMNAGTLNDLNAIFVAAQVSKGTSVLFTIPKTDLNFNCNSYGIEGVSHSLSGQFIFSPEKLNTDKLVSWSESWDLGFRITNFLFLTSPYIKYYIAYDSMDYETARLAQRIYDDMPKNIAKELIQIDREKIESQNFEKIIVLFLNKDESYIPGENVFDPSEFKSYEKDEIIFIYAQGVDTKTIEDSIITKLLFKNKGFESIGSGLPMIVYDESSLYGAFISGSYDLTSCILRKAFAKAYDIVKVYKYRTDNLESSTCSYYYELSMMEFDSMLDNLKGEGGVINIDELKENIVKLNGYNDLFETYSCPLIY